MHTRVISAVGISLLMASALLAVYACHGGTSPASSFTGVFTQRYDPQRTGQNRQESILTPSNVTGSTFGKLFACAVDGEVYAQPLYVANFLIQGGTHNVVFVATMNDSVYAFDADASPCVQYWKTSFLVPGVTTIVPPVDTGETGDINTIIGITGTPVIDPATGTLYVVAKTKEPTGYFQRLHRSEEHTSELQSRRDLVCRLLLEKKKKK